MNVYICILFIITYIYICLYMLWATQLDLYFINHIYNYCLEFGVLDPWMVAPWDFCLMGMIQSFIGSVLAAAKRSYLRIPCPPRAQFAQTEKIKGQQIH